MAAYARMTMAERRSIEQGLSARRSCREIARSIGRTPSAVSEEVRRNRTLAERSSKGMRPKDDAKENDCDKMRAWPWTCNTCFTFPKACGRHPRCEYRAIYAQKLADERASESRRGINAREEDFERIAFAVRDDVARGLSPEQVCMRHPHLGLSPSTLYRWIERGMFGMSNMDLRRKVGYRPRKEGARPKPTSHGEERSYSAFCALPEEARERACEMDTVIGRARDSQCLLTLYLRPCRVQLALLLPEKTSGAVAAALDGLERALGGAVFARLFGTLLTDNGAEFSDTEAIERSVEGPAPRCKAYYCDVRSSNQKGRCERNHVELRKLLPKGRGVDFDMLEPRDCAILMSHLNSEPRPSLMGLTPFQLMRAADPEAAGAVMDALGLEEVAPEELDMTTAAIDADRASRGLKPLL